MIYFISDVHEDINFIGLKKYLEIATKNDLLIILGDVGLNFQDTKQNRLFTEQFLSIDKNIAFIEGNHENFAYLDNFPTEKWNGGTVNRLTDKIVRLIRGNIYEIDGYKFFTFGGCKSSKKWKEQGLWHFGEEPTLEQIDFAKNTLIQHANTVDFVLTHKYEIIGQGENSPLLVDLCKFIDQNVSYKKWLSGHWHREYSLDDKHIYLHENLRSIKEIFQKI